VCGCNVESVLPGLSLAIPTPAWGSVQTQARLEKGGTKLALDRKRGKARSGSYSMLSSILEGVTVWVTDRQQTS